MRPRTREQRFEGRIAGFGSTSGTRFVVGMWQHSPFGRFVDVMIEQPGGHRTLLAPSDAVAEYVSTTYTFDQTTVLDVSFRRIDGGLRIDARAGTESTLSLSLAVGTLTPLGRLLRAIPPPLATAPAWLTLIDPAARVLVPGARTSGSAGAGRREYYGVRTIRALTAISGHYDGSDVGALARLDPPVTFGFGSAPAAPSLVDLTTVIRQQPEARE
ncbi:hypothetical protein D4765_04390 [Subtercola vilae]|uniref:Uncharacterized protein n=2 Tax=Microbacteriaceae TaxID=85023 RepID=A0A4T2C7Y7_9MICO|nr:hypothetical protein D4765_04390 [Subtercola vilae]